MKDKNNTTSEDYLDSLLNSIMNNEETSTNEDLGLFSVSEDEIEDDFMDEIEGDIFAELESEDMELEDEDFGKDVSYDELFGLDDDIMTMIDQSEKEDNGNKIHEIIKDNEAEDNAIDDTEPISEAVSALDVDEAIATNDSTSDDDLQGLLDVMGIEDDSQDVSIDLPKEKKKKKLFGKKNKKAKKNEKKPANEEEQEMSFASNDMLDLSSLGSMISNAGEDVHSLDFSSIDNLSTEETYSDDAFKVSENLDFDFGDDFETVEEDAPATEAVEASDASSSKSDFDDFGFEYMDEDEGKDKKKGNKKKDKAKKSKKEKKEKKPKKPVKKKEKLKRLKEPDEIIKVSKGFVFMLLSLIAVAIFALLFGGDYYVYNKKLSKATNEFVNQNYSAAYDAVFGLEMKKKDDEELFNQIQTVMFVNRHYEAYTYLIKMDEYEQGLYSLLKGVKMFDKYQNTGRELNCYDDMQDVLGWIDKGLMETYGLTESQARELNLLNNDEQLGVKVCEIAQVAREKAEAEKEAAEQALKDEASKEKEE